jgi:hypothetical protein
MTTDLTHHLTAIEVYGDDGELTGHALADRLHRRIPVTPVRDCAAHAWRDAPHVTRGADGRFGYHQPVYGAAYQRLANRTAAEAYAERTRLRYAARDRAL